MFYYRKTQTWVFTPEDKEATRKLYMKDTMDMSF